jgi:hypothetical protein
LQQNRKEKMMPLAGIADQALSTFTSVEAAGSGDNRRTFQMIRPFRRVWTRAALLSTALFATAALAQAPSEAQREAIKSQCRNDFIAHCSSVPPGGEAALQCLQKNMSSLSTGCAGAVRAAQAPAASPTPPAAKTDTAAAPKTGSTPAAGTAAKPTPDAAAPKTASPAAKQPTDAQVSAIRTACRSDFQKVCPGMSTSGAPALKCLEKNKAKLSPACGQAVAAASGDTAAPASDGASTTAAAPPAGAAAPAAPTVMVLRPLRPREELFVVRSACGVDVRSLCAGVPAGGGRIVQCLASNAASLSPACKDVLSQFAAR